MNPARLFLFAIATLSFGIATFAGEPELRFVRAMTKISPPFSSAQKPMIAAAQTDIGFSCYDLGMHVKPDGKESIRWITKAANQGYVPAEYELGTDLPLWSRHTH